MATTTIELVADVRLTRSGRAMRLIDGNGRMTGAGPTGRFLACCCKRATYWAELRKGELNITELAKREGVQDAYITRVLRLAFLSPAIVDAIVNGTQPASLSSSKVMLGFELPQSWRAQQHLLVA